MFLKPMDSGLVRAKKAPCMADLRLVPHSPGEKGHADCEDATPDTVKVLRQLRLDNDRQPRELRGGGGSGHLTGKLHTKGIEENNCRPRHRDRRLFRKTCCLSRHIKHHHILISGRYKSLFHLLHQPLSYSNDHHTIFLGIMDAG